MSASVEVRRAVQALIERADFEAAAEQAAAALEGDALAKTDRVALLYLRAVACRYAERNADAFAALDALRELDPQHARAWQERGHLHLSANDFTEASAAYELATLSNPTLVASWRALENLYVLKRDGGQSQTEAHARKLHHVRTQMDYFGGLPAQLLGAQSLLYEGRVKDAGEVCRAFLRGEPRHIEGMRTLAKIEIERSRLPDAEFLLETARALEPRSRQICYDLANLKLRMQQFSTAHALTAELVAAQPDNHAFLALHANAAAGVGDFDAALAAYDRVLGATQGQYQLHVMRGHALKTVGRLDEAIDAYRRAYDIKADHGDAYWSLANTKRYRFPDGELERMRALNEDPGTATNDRIGLNFALGKAYEDRGEPGVAFEHYARGNKLQHDSVMHTPEFLRLRADAQIELCSAEFFAARAGIGAPAPDPIFIVGLPRAGSTLLEQILASHSAVDGTMELPHIPALTQRLRRGAGGSRRAFDGDASSLPPYPRVLGELTPELFRRFGEQYLEQTRSLRGEAAYFIDKHPNNFFHIGLLKLILPNAKVIDARRHPMSCGFSCFKQLFGEGQEFTYDLFELGNYYREYVRLMAHWDSVLPGFVHRVQHEALVDDLEGEVRALLEFCGLPFEQACLDFHETERSVRTPSSEQVRQPIFRTALDAWRPFEAWLTPLKRGLGEEICAAYGIELTGAD
ncbi:MAG: sulfotransferase [Pseudomonadota bacterium]